MQNLPATKVTAPEELSPFRGRDFSREITLKLIQADYRQGLFW